MTTPNGGTVLLTLPLPPNAHTNWVSLRDLGTLTGNEESVRVSLTTLVTGRVYELYFYSLTAATNQTGFSNFAYSGKYIDNFTTTVDGTGNGQQILTTTTNAWQTQKVTFTATAATNNLTFAARTNATGVTNNAAGFLNAETVQISVSPNAINGVPTAGADAANTLQNAPVTFSVTANDSDPGGSLNLTSVDLDPATQGFQTTFTNTQGTWTVTGGNVTFTPVSTFVGTATIPYTIQDNFTLDGANLPATSAPATISVTVIADTDFDGVPNSIDLDDDNDGILDTAEGCTATVTMATINATSITALNALNTAVFPLVPPGATLPGGGVTVTRTSTGLGNTWNSFTPPVATATTNVNGVQTAPFSTTYLDIVGTVARTFSVDFGVTASSISTANNSYQYIIGIAGLGGEGQSVTNTFSVPLTVASNVNVFNTNQFSLLNGVTPVQGATGNIFSTSTPTGTAQGYTFFLVPANVASVVMTLAGGNDPHGIIFGVYNANCNTDTDNDGIPNYLDLDSDNDNCFDAIEGNENVQNSQLNANGSINIATTGGVNAQGIPNLVNPGGLADNGAGTIGQLIGASQNSAISACFCYKPAIATLGGQLNSNHGITALRRAGVDQGNWPMVRKGAWTVLESRTKGFVPNRLTTTQIAAIPAADLIEGMMVYNITLDCLQVNTTGTPAGWACFNTQTCPIN
ncbi:hypothetical protein ASG01_07415 [Chryseobacterium sp. Leaf180]|nr:hypothetical protein ASG01_07415 [Chryseobacterium sp. Leaf180]